MARCLVGLGSNLGDRRALLNDAVSRLSRNERLHVAAVSQWCETKAVGGPAGQSLFLNGAALLETDLSPQRVLDLLQAIESELGRTRAAAWGPRTIDLDLLLYDECALQTARLTLPHPRMAWRRFVLEPASEVAAEMLHPDTGWTIARLLKHLDSAHNYVALAGPIGVGKTRLAREIAEKTGARLISERLDDSRLGRFYADPSSTAWAMELEFWDERKQLLATDSPRWPDRQELVVSDFWFDQSAAFARVWLNAEDFARFEPRWQAARQHVVRPKLIVLLNRPGFLNGARQLGATPAVEDASDWLRDRVQHRGRPYEAGLSSDTLERIAQSVWQQAADPDVGPVLRLSVENRQYILNEVVAAIEAMK